MNTYGNPTSVTECPKVPPPVIINLEAQQRRLNELVDVIDMLKGRLSCVSSPRPEQSNKQTATPRGVAPGSSGIATALSELNDRLDDAIKRLHMLIEDLEI